MSIPKIFTIAELNERLNKVASANRYDQVSRVMHEIFEKRASKNPEELISSSDFAVVFSKVANLNKQSDFRFHFSDVFEGNTPTEGKQSEDVGAASRLDGYSEDFRPTPVEVSVSKVEKIKQASLSAISSVLDGIVDNPQYHFDEYVEVEGYGKDSGFASWTVAFNTGKGMARISVPTPVVDGVVEMPSVFYASAGKPITFDSDGIQKFSKSYVGSVKQATTGSGVETLGGTSIITERQDIQENIAPALEVNFGLGTVVEQDLGVQSASSVNKKKLVASIDVARKFVEAKLGPGVELQYSAGMENDDKTYVVAFNVSRNTSEGVKVATIPVEVDGERCVAEAFYGSDQQAHPLESQQLNVYFNAGPAEFNAPEVEAYADSFLANEASFQQLKDELKFAAFSGKTARAKSVLFAIGNRFGDDSLDNAMDDFKTWTNEAIEVKAGKKAKPMDIVERESAFDGVVKTSSIVFN